MGRLNCSAPDGHRRTCASTSSAVAAYGRTQSRRWTSNTAGSPRTHTPEWMQMFGSKVTVIWSVS
jgi:hypothetical protein